jgi:hypothetical protein
MNGLVYKEDGEMVAYVHLAYGPTGILAQPFIHTGTDHAERLLRSLHGTVPNIRSRPVYLVVRSHQAWLAPFLDELGYTSSPRQAVMVKRLVVPIKDLAPARRNNPGLENVQPEITTTSTNLSQLEARRLFPAFDRDDTSNK